MVIHFIRKIIRNSESSLTARLFTILTGSVFITLFFAFAFYFAERNAQEGLTIWDSIWWAMVTMTTVGYGDFYAQTWIGRILVSFPCFIFGNGLIGYLIGILVEGIIEITSKKRKGNAKSRMKNHIIICHCPSESKVLNIAKEIRASAEHQNVPICIIDDKLEERPTSFKQQNIDFVKGNPTEEDCLKKANIEVASGVVVLAKRSGDTTSDSSSFAIITIVELISEELNRPIKTTAEVINTKSDKLFHRSKVDGTVFVEGITDKMVVQEFLYPGIHDTFQQLLTNTSGSQFYSCETKLIGHRLVEIQSAALQHHNDLQIIGLNRNGEQMLNPSKEIAIEQGDKLLVLAETQQEYQNLEDDLLKA